MHDDVSPLVPHPAKLPRQGFCLTGTFLALPARSGCAMSSAHLVTSASIQLNSPSFRPSPPFNLSPNAVQEKTRTAILQSPAHTSHRNCISTVPFFASPTPKSSGGVSYHFVTPAIRYELYPQAAHRQGVPCLQFHYWWVLILHLLHSECRVDTPLASSPVIAPFGLRHGFHVPRNMDLQRL